MTTQQAKEHDMIREVASLLCELRSTINDDYRASEDPDDDTPGMQVTIASDNGQSWVFQTGDNSYTGACYSYHHWGVGAVYQNDCESDCRAMATQMVDEVFEQLASIQ